MIEICGFDPATGRKTGNLALIDRFRNSGINIQGVLLRNQEFIDNPVGTTKGKYTKADAQVDIARMSFFLPVVEQEGGVTAGAFITGGPSTFNCGSYVGAGGVLQTVSDPLDIIWPPVQFSCLANNGRVLPIEQGKIKIDSALTRFSVTAATNDFSLKNSNGELIANNKGAVKGDVTSNFITNSKTIIEVTGKIDNSSQVTKPGVWSITSSDLERAVVCGYLDLGIELKVGTCYLGEKCNYSGQINRFGVAVDLSKFQSVRADAALFDENRGTTTASQLNIDPEKSTFSSSFIPKGLSQISNLKIALRVVTETGIEFNIGTIKPIAVIPPGLYPEITPSPITQSDFKQGLIGKSGTALASLNLKGPSRTNGQICISALEVRSDVNPNRIANYTSSFDGKDLNSNPCFTLIAGSSRKFDFEVSNKQSADGSVSGYIPVTLKADGQPDVKTKIDVQFQTSTLTDKGKFAILFPLLMFLGIALPLAMLAFINSRNSRLILDNLYRASIPIKLTAAGNFVNLERIENIKSNELLSHEDFNPFSSGREVVRSKQIGSETLTGYAPKNPFGNLQAIISAPSGQAIVTSAFKSGKNKFMINQAQGVLNPSGFIYVTLGELDNEKLKSQNQGDTENSSIVEGSLTALLSLNTADPLAQVDYLNTKILHETGWLNNLLQLERSQKVNHSNKKSKRLKRGNVSENISAPTTIDEWGSLSDRSNENVMNPGITKSSNSPRAAHLSGDDWGTSSTTSDWDTPGSSNNPGSKEEW